MAVKRLLPAQCPPSYQLVEGEEPSSSTQTLREGCSGQPEEAGALSLATFGFSEILQELKSQFLSNRRRNWDKALPNTLSLPQLESHRQLLTRLSYSGLQVFTKKKKKNVYVLVSFPLTVIEHHDENNLREKGLFNSQFRVPVLPGGKAREAGLGTASYIPYPVKKTGAVAAYMGLSALSIYLVPDRSQPGSPHPHGINTLTHIH